MRLLKEIRRRRGEVSEGRVRQAMEELADRNSSLVETGGSVPWIIETYWFSDKFSRDDVNGIDLTIVVCTDDFTTVPIDVQIKSSKSSAIRHAQAHQNIPAVVVHPLKTQEDLIQELSKIISQVISFGS